MAKLRLSRLHPPLVPTTTSARSPRKHARDMNGKTKHKTNRNCESGRSQAPRRYRVPKGLAVDDRHGQNPTKWSILHSLAHLTQTTYSRDMQTACASVQKRAALLSQSEAHANKLATPQAGPGGRELEREMR